MLNRKYRVAEKQMGTGIMHHRPYPLSHLGAVTVDSAFEAGGLLLLERAEVKPLVAVG
jgi:hypothetical protein